MSAPSCLRILAASAVMLSAITFVIVDQNYISEPQTGQEAVPIKGDSLLQAAAVGKSAVDCKWAESAPKGADAGVEAAESMFYMESLIPLLGFAFCIPLRRLWLSLQDERSDGGNGKMTVIAEAGVGAGISTVAATDAIVSPVLAQVDEVVVAATDVGSTTKKETELQPRLVFRESRRAFQDALDELDEDLATLPAALKDSVFKEPTQSQPKLVFRESRRAFQEALDELDESESHVGVKLASESQPEAPLNWLALANAARSGDIAKFEKMIAAHDPNSQDTWGVSLLHTAALAGSESIAKSLLQRGADHSARDLWEDTPLHYAARGGCAKVCQLLLNAGAQCTMNAQDWTPLLVAAHAGHGDVCKMFFDAGFEVGAQDNELPMILQGLLIDKLIAGLPRTPMLTMVDDRDNVPSDISCDEAVYEEDE